jgi:hypothetical protein
MYNHNVAKVALARAICSADKSIQRFLEVK